MRFVLWVLVVLTGAWACAALWFDGPASRPLAGGLAAAPDWAVVVSQVPIVWTSALTGSRPGVVDHSVTTELSSFAVD